MVYCTCPWWLWWCRIWWNEDWQGKPKYSEKTCPSATLATTNPTWPDPDSNTGRRRGKPATNRLSYGAATAMSGNLQHIWTQWNGAWRWTSQNMPFSKQYHKRNCNNSKFCHYSSLFPILYCHISSRNRHIVVLVYRARVQLLPIYLKRCF
jgi:hypothetical protein